MGLTSARLGILPFFVLGRNTNFHCRSPCGQWPCISHKSRTCASRSSACKGSVASVLAEIPSKPAALPHIALATFLRWDPENLGRLGGVWGAGRKGSNVSQKGVSSTGSWLVPKIWLQKFLSSVAMVVAQVKMCPWLLQRTCGIGVSCLSHLHAPGKVCILVFQSLSFWDCFFFSITCNLSWASFWAKPHLRFLTASYSSVGTCEICNRFLSASGSVFPRKANCWASCNLRIQRRSCLSWMSCWIPIRWLLCLTWGMVPKLRSHVWESNPTAPEWMDRK